MNTRIYAFDLGSTTGMAVGSSQFLGHIEEIKTYSIELATKKVLTQSKTSGQIRFLDPRVKRFSQMLEAQGQGTLKPDLLVFEDVVFGRSLAQVQLWSSFRGALWSFASRQSVPIVGIQTGTLKKWTTGKGNAEKEDMKRAAARRWPTMVRDSMTHDEIDALALLMWGFEYWYKRQLSLGET